MALISEEIDNIILSNDTLYKEIQKIKSFGNSTAAGSAVENSKTGVVTAQYPAERSAGNDTGITSTNDLYENGLIFKAYNYESRSTTDLTSQRKQQQSGIDSSLASIITSAKKSIGRDQTNSDKVNKSLVCIFLLPRSSRTNN